jgi:tRNA pseudouridine55 synthase
MNGLLPIDKPVGMSSFDVIRVVRRTSGFRKWGHIGTLDPFADGLLPLLCGNAARLSQYLDDGVKTYRAEMRLGIRTDTGDPTGQVVEERPIPKLTSADLEAVVPAILDIREQTPPAYSAIKIQGRPAYKLARKGETPELKSRPIRILSFEFLALDNDRVSYRATVSKGTYIRVLTETIGSMLDTNAHTITLRRESIGKLDVSEAVRPDDLLPETWSGALVSPMRLMPEYPGIDPDGDLLARFRNGRAFACNLDDAPVVLVRDSEGEIVGVGCVENGELRPRTVLA